MKKCKNCKTVFKPKLKSQYYCDNQECQNISISTKNAFLQKKIESLNKIVKIMMLLTVIILGSVIGIGIYLDDKISSIPYTTYDYSKEQGKKDAEKLMNENRSRYNY